MSRLVMYCKGPDTSSVALRKHTKLVCAMPPIVYGGLHTPGHVHRQVSPQRTIKQEHMCDHVLATSY